MTQKEQFMKVNLLQRILWDQGVENKYIGKFDAVIPIIQRGSTRKIGWPKTYQIPIEILQ
jgi:hypothetical protein